MTATKGRERLLSQLATVAAAAARGARIAVPEAGRLPWRWFCDLNATRTWHAAGPNPITYAEISAYSASMRLDLRAQDVELVRAIDDHWVAAQYAKLREAAGDTRPTSEIRSWERAQAVSPASFDAVFG